LSKKVTEDKFANENSFGIHHYWHIVKESNRR